MPAVREEEEMEVVVDEGDGKGLVYDPDQDPDERRDVRKSYRTLQEDEDLQNPAGISIAKLNENLTKANNLFEKVKAPQEATLDSAYLVRLSDANNRKASAMRSTVGGFDIDDFIAKLITFMGGNRQGELRTIEDGDGEEMEEEIVEAPLEWEKIGRKAMAKSRRVPATDFMLGPLSIEAKKRNVGKKRNVLDKGKEEEKRPQELKEDDIEKSENETTKNVILLERTLEECGPINMFRLVVNPDNFGQTVENLFYLSFLIRDGKVCLEDNEETGEPTVYLCEAPTVEDYVQVEGGGQGLKKHQMVMELDMETWKRAIDVFNITEPKLPTRGAAKIRIGDKWYG